MNEAPTILHIPESVYVFQICLGAGCVVLAFVGGFFFGVNREARRRAR